MKITAVPHDGLINFAVRSPAYAWSIFIVRVMLEAAVIVPAGKVMLLVIVPDPKFELAECIVAA